MKFNRELVLKYILIFSTGILIFFVIAYITFFIRTRNVEKVAVPNLVGKYYLDVHNELMKLNLKTQIEKEKYLNKSDGIILSQSIAPGDKVSHGTKIYLTVNIGVDQVQVPNLIGQSLESAENTLKKVLSDQSFVELTIGGITYVEPKDGELSNTVIDQFPKVGFETTTREKVYLLVTKNNVSKGTSKENLINQPFPFVEEKLAREGRRYKIKEIIPTKTRSFNGLVDHVVQNGKDFLLNVNFFSYENRVEIGYEMVEFKSDESSNYKLVIKDTKKKTIKELTNISLNKGIKYYYVFFREGDVNVELFDSSGDSVYDEDFESEI